MNNDCQDTPILTALASLITVSQALEQEITDAIIGDEEIADRASADLAQIRKKMRVVSDRVRDKLNGIVHGSGYAKFLQESIITMRNGRLLRTGERPSTAQAFPDWCTTKARPALRCS